MRRCLSDLGRNGVILSRIEGVTSLVGAILRQWSSEDRRSAGNGWRCKGMSRQCILRMHQRKLRLRHCKDKSGGCELYSRHPCFDCVFSNGRRAGGVQQGRDEVKPSPVSLVEDLPALAVMDVEVVPDHVQRPCRIAFSHRLHERQQIGGCPGRPTVAHHVSGPSLESGPARSSFRDAGIRAQSGRVGRDGDFESKTCEAIILRHGKQQLSQTDKRY